MAVLQSNHNRATIFTRIFCMPHSAKTESTPVHLDELDLAIPDMDSPTTENQVKAALEKMPGIKSVRLVERGAFIRYNAAVIDKDQICQLIRQAGFRASTFQDSKTGATGLSSQ